jgi:SAM-dependent methyltransferase
MTTGDRRRPNTGRSRVSPLPPLPSPLADIRRSVRRPLPFSRPVSSFAPPNFNPEIYDVLDGLPYPSEFFDVIHQRNLSKWVPDLGALFREVHRCLKPGGIFLVTEPTVSRLSRKSGQTRKRVLTRLPVSAGHTCRRVSLRGHRGAQNIGWRWSAMPTTRKWPRRRASASNGPSVRSNESRITLPLLTADLLFLRRYQLSRI